MTTLSRDQIKVGTQKGLRKYENLDFLGKYSMFMGMAQILEFGLKKLLEEKFGYSLDDMEKWTLGKTKSELGKNNLRPDFMYLLESVVEYRNYIAHEMLLNSVLIRSLLNSTTEFNQYSKEERIIDKAIIELEQLVFLFDWTNENNGW